MVRTVAVIDPAAALRRGLMAALADVGFEPVVPDDLEDWVEDRDEAAVVMALREPVDRKIVSILRTEHPELALVGLLDDPDPEDYRRALADGATTAVDRASDPDEIVAALEAAVAGRSLLPYSVVCSMCTNGQNGEAQVLGPAEVRWIRALAQGSTVGALAAQEGHSERDMFRILADLYLRMGVKHRTEALLKATRWGLITDA